MKQFKQHNIDYHISEADLHNKNPVEGVILELIPKWYIIIIKKRVLRKLWYYGLRWIYETSSLTHFPASRVIDGGNIHLTQVRGALLPFGSI